MSSISASVLVVTSKQLCLFKSWKVGPQKLPGCSRGILEGSARCGGGKTANGNGGTPAACFSETLTKKIGKSRRKSEMS